jgi:hypothetical protein
MVFIDSSAHDRARCANCPIRGRQACDNVAIRVVDGDAGFSIISLQHASRAFASTRSAMPRAARTESAHCIKDVSANHDSGNRSVFRGGRKYEMAIFAGSPRASMRPAWFSAFATQAHAELPANETFFTCCNPARFRSRHEIDREPADSGRLPRKPQRSVPCVFHFVRQLSLLRPCA